jgi:hypothetical protein
MCEDTCVRITDGKDAYHSGCSVSLGLVIRLKRVPALLNYTMSLYYLYDRHSPRPLHSTAYQQN